MSNCVNKEINLKNCNCTYSSCGRKGVCCECILYHRKNRQLPACFFNPQAERAYDRSVENFIKINQK
ncbi:MAG: hypothetical protein COV72_08390 [Candidatus Omnitrophica bacterium CG11_big_fil_rev_8_21_14_0_20_42_13]|uniref:Cytosolic protein n=1 Tax=Candidatus Ghiorseimicrobium undicola TaxID=1974746 RepID=A0A2H0LXV2_9BACT|nr:MAG: hypothetical protein COV72_08390 [Candidatus Omnitrophica bacterium CG11_big_fil_rev_8_21_14_0_20_42_13]